MLGGQVPYHVTDPMMHMIYLPSPAVGRQTDACENITFPKLRMRAVIAIPCSYLT